MDELVNGVEEFEVVRKKILPNNEVHYISSGGEGEGGGSFHQKKY